MPKRKISEGYSVNIGGSGASGGGGGGSSLAGVGGNESGGGGVGSGGGGSGEESDDVVPIPIQFFFWNQTRSNNKIKKYFLINIGCFLFCFV